MPAIGRTWYDEVEGSAELFTPQFCALLERLHDSFTPLDGSGKAEQAERCQKSAKIALRWIKNYTEYNFRPLGTYARVDLDQIAAAPDAF